MGGRETGRAVEMERESDLTLPHEKRDRTTSREKKKYRASIKILDEMKVMVTTHAYGKQRDHRKNTNRGEKGGKERRRGPTCRRQAENHQQLYSPKNEAKRVSGEERRTGAEGWVKAEGVHSQ